VGAKLAWCVRASGAVRRVGFESWAASRLVYFTHMERAESGKRTAAQKTADLVQMRIIREKLTSGKPLFPDEEALIGREGGTPEQKRKGFQAEARKIIKEISQRESFWKKLSNSTDRGEGRIGRLAEILELAALIREYYQTDSATREQVGHSVVRMLYKHAGLTSLTEIDLGRAADLVDGEMTIEEIASRLLKN